MKSAGAVTESMSAIWVMELEVPVSVMVETPTSVLLAALNVISPVIPWLKLRAAGLTVTATGTPVIMTVTGDVRPLMTVRLSAT